MHPSPSSINRNRTYQNLGGGDIYQLSVIAQVHGLFAFMLRRFSKIMRCSFMPSISIVRLLGSLVSLYNLKYLQIKT